MNVGFERIHPVPGYPTGTTAALLYGLPWNSGRQVVTTFKRELKIALRASQMGRCCFCRRLLYDDYAVHLEHFVDQASHADHRFEIRNLALSCGTCNARKNGYFSTWSTRYRRLTKNHATTQTPTLKFQLNAGAPFPSASGDFRWVNPYVHHYSAHIQLVHGWVFTGRTLEGRRTVRGLRLNELADIERRALTERLEMRGGRLSTLVATLPEFNQHRARDIARAVAVVLARRRRARAALT
jgi:hypothetical protein